MEPTDKDRLDWQPLPRRLTDIPDRVRIAADKRCGKVILVYYDRLHTGDSYDELMVNLDDGTSVSGPANLFETIDDETATSHLRPGRE